jgi:hypothetical protein
MGKWATLVLMIAGCLTSSPPPDLAAKAETTFTYSVYPILLEKCASNSGGCHADSNGLVLDPNNATAYQSALVYAGDFTSSAPLLTAHASAPIDIPLDAGTVAAIEAWFEQERAARGLSD